jgi:steroid delta-isomerase-like uncharacterized protein/uncharacterized protein (TIGR02246 family)
MKFSRIHFALSVCALSTVAACGEEAAVAPPPQPPVATVTAPAPPPPPPLETTPPPAPPKPSMAEMQKVAMQTALEGLNAHDAAKFASVYADNAMVSVAGLNELAGRAAVEQNMKEWFETFSKIKLGFRRVWIKGDVLVLEWVINGTHSGDLFGVKGKENPIGHYGLSLVWFDENGKVKRENRYGELGAVLTQADGKQKAKEIPTVPAAAEMIPAKGSPEEDKLLEAAKGLHAAVEKKSEADFLALVSDDFVYEGVVGFDQIKGKADTKKFFGGLTKAFPDIKFSPSAAWAIGDYVIVEYQMSGTHKAALGTVPASKKPVNVHLVDVAQIKDGKVQRAWTYQNSVEFLSQVGQVNVAVVNPTAAAPAKGPAKAPAAPKK